MLAPRRILEMFSARVALVRTCCTHHPPVSEPDVRVAAYLHDSSDFFGSEPKLCRTEPVHGHRTSCQSQTSGPSVDGHSRSINTERGPVGGPARMVGTRGQKRRAAVQRLSHVAQQGDECTITALKAHLDDQNWNVRRTSLEVLGRETQSGGW